MAITMLAQLNDPGQPLLPQQLYYTKTKKVWHSVDTYPLISLARRE
jgi:hypothetical protein